MPTFLLLFYFLPQLPSADTISSISLPWCTLWSNQVWVGLFHWIPFFFLSFDFLSCLYLSCGLFRDYAFSNLVSSQNRFLKSRKLFIGLEFILLSSAWEEICSCWLARLILIEIESTLSIAIEMTYFQLTDLLIYFFTISRISSHSREREREFFTLNQ